MTTLNGREQSAGTRRFLDRGTPPHIATLVLAAGLAAMSMNIFLPSLAAMADHFGTSYAVMQFAVSGYLAGTAAIQIAIGPLSDIFGRRPVMIGGIVLLLLGTLICAFAPNIAVFMAGRMIQTGVVAGIVLSRAIVRDMVPMDEAASMIGYVTMGMSVVPMIAPTLGGLLNDLFGWQASFFALLISGLLVLALVWRDLGETNTAQSASFGAQFRSWPQLLTSRRFWGYTLTATFSSGVFFSFLGGAPFVGTVLFQLSPAALGLYFFGMAAGYMLGNYLSGRYARRFGIGPMMVSGNIVNVIGLALAFLLSVLDAAHPLAFFGPLSLIGVGNGLTLPSANAGMVSVRPHLAGSASGLGGAIMLGGGAALSVVAGAVLHADGGTLPLLVVMTVTALLALLATEYVRLIDRREGELAQENLR
ncbi:DHA1 family bicyclomycin/chloramphenicol resistance-like MFS transporter [Pseudorhizobium tarimense]|uniref:Bcr/CflA family efflux transporter n=1 Tax=Pseudorhizobium tarimense TaxID=1079109 RepID=A0ABV2H2V9_9HYPH|nr:multidrug effflux MFS transporter [Pseudorhizobium tarimense]MCJ8518135.1 multidrug effflux MFS transporter [Pseudorhizobium tarimense]